MSSASKPPASPNTLERPIPAWFGAGLIGLILGAGGTLIVVNAKAKTAEFAAALNNAPAAAPTVSGAPPAIAVPMSGMMMGGGGARGTKRNLTSLVGEIDLLTRESLHIELSADQAAKLAEQLAKFEHAEKMTNEEAQAQLDTLTALLTPEQRAVTDAISLPFGRPGGGFGGGGPPGGGGAPAMDGLGPGGGPMEDENPFRQEANQKRLRNLLTRLRPADAAPAKIETPPAEKK